MRKVFSSLLTFALIVLVNLNVYASETKEVEVIDGSVLTNNAYSEDIYINPAKGNILNRAAVKITNNGDGSVNVYGAVYGSVTCDEMILRMTLQRLVNGNWQNVKTFSDTANNKGYLIKSYNVTVTKGYYYRVKGACVATKNGVSESHVPVTDGIMIN